MWNEHTHHRAYDPLAPDLGDPTRRLGKVIILVLCLPWVLSYGALVGAWGLVRGASSARSERRTQRQAARTEAERLRDNPFAGDLLRARENLLRLQGLPDTPSVKKAIRSTLNVINALEKAPDTISAEVADEVAAQILHDNELVLDRPEALRRAHKDLGPTLRA